MSGTQWLTMGELAQVYAALARVRPGLSAGAPTVVSAGVSIDAAAVERLHRFGVDVHVIDEPTLAPGVYLLGGTMHGTLIPPDITDPGTEVVASVQRVRLRDWAAGLGPEPEFTTMHTPGSDSRGVVQFRVGDRQIVAKIGNAEAIAAEAGFATEANALLTREGRPGLFPVPYGLRIEGDQAVSLMEAGNPLPIGPLFADPTRMVLADRAVALLEPHLHQLAAWYRLTVDDVAPTVADYLYRERYHVLLTTPAFVATFRSFFGDLPMTDLFTAPVQLPGGLVVPGYREAVAWLDTVVPRLLPGYGSAVHGDIYAANMLSRADGSPMLIDPRPVWEGRNRPDIGYGDPVYDLATLLHGVLPMAAVLQAVATGTTDALFGDEIRPDEGKLDLSSLRLPVDFPPAVRALEARMLQALPRADEHARIRLYIGAATSLAGWLKYERSLRTPLAWLATYAFITWYLWQARTLWEAEDGTNRKQVS